ncbi:MAG: hypothetical protein R3314_03055 [Longimicrobiales bacterium]|nr:hypothetical protein [Longimicrobiales bacterium]
MQLRALTILALGAIALAGCEDVLGTDGELTADEIHVLADDIVAASFDVTGPAATADASTVDAERVSADPITSRTEFVTIRSCPLGGQLVVEGTREREWDRETRSGSSDLSLTKTHEDCARTLRRADVTITLNGAPNVAVEAHHAWENGRRVGLQTLGIQGAIDWETDDGRSGVCTLDVDAVFDPETHTRTVTGTVCDRTIERTTTWNHPDA